MGRRKNEAMARDIEALRQDVDRWRETRAKRGRMPENLWTRATELARRYGVTVVAQHLGVHHTRLKKRTEDCAGDSGDQEAIVAADSTFIDLGQMLPIEQFNQGDFVMNISGADGSTMSVRMPVAAAPEVSTLVESFFRRQP